MKISVYIIAFNEAEKIDYGIYNHPDDKSGESKVNAVFFHFKSNDSAYVACIDWSKKFETDRNWIDHLRVSLQSKEYSYWIENEAY